MPSIQELEDWAVAAEEVSPHTHTHTHTHAQHRPPTANHLHCILYHQPLTTFFLLEKIAVKAGAILLKGREEGYEIMSKGGVDLVTAVDQASEKLILDFLTSKYCCTTI